MKQLLLLSFLILTLNSAAAQTNARGVFKLTEIKELMGGSKSAIEANLKRKGFTLFTRFEDGIHIYEKKGSPIDVRFKMTDGIVTLIAWQELKKAIMPILKEIEAEKWEFPANKEGNAFRDPNTGMKFMVFPYEGNPALLKVFVGM